MRDTIDPIAGYDQEISAPTATSESGATPTFRFIYPHDLLVEPERLRDHVLNGGSNGACAEGVEPDATWWLVYTKSRMEKRLSDQLRKMEIAHYLPVTTREAVTRGKLRLVEEPLFAGYLFMLADGEQRHDALKTNRISVTHPAHEVDAERLPFELANLEKSIKAGAHLTLEAGFEPGEWVRVKSGKHVGLEGTVVRRRNKAKLVLSVTFLKQGASFEIADCYLERATPPEMSNAGSVEIVGRS